MVKVIFLDRQYDQAIPLSSDPVSEFNRLKRNLGKGTKPNINRKLATQGINQSIDDVIQQQRLNGYLSRKGIVILYPEFGSLHYDSGVSLVYPYNLSPQSSLATLIALNERTRKGQTELPFDGRVRTPFEFSSKEEWLLNDLLKYESVTKPSSGDRRGFVEREVYSAANTFLEAYRSLRGDVLTNGKGKFKSFVLMLAYVATYHKIKKILQGDKILRAKFNTLPEFMAVPHSEADLDETIGIYQRKPVHRYMISQDLAKRLAELSPGNPWTFIRSDLEKIPTKGSFKPTK